MTPRRHSPDDDTGPALLPTFVAGTIVMVLAVVGMARLDSDWADLGAVVLLGVVAGLLLLAIARRLNDDDDEDLP